MQPLHPCFGTAPGGGLFDIVGNGPGPQALDEGRLHVKVPPAHTRASTVKQLTHLGRESIAGYGSKERHGALSNPKRQLVPGPTPLGKAYQAELAHRGSRYRAGPALGIQSCQRGE